MRLTSSSVMDPRLRTSVQCNFTAIKLELRSRHWRQRLSLRIKLSSSSTLPHGRGRSSPQLSSIELLSGGMNQINACYAECGEGMQIVHACQVCNAKCQKKHWESIKSNADDMLLSYATRRSSKTHRRRRIVPFAFYRCQRDPSATISSVPIKDFADGRVGR